MKKSLLIFALVLCIAVLFCGCKKDKGETASKPDSDKITSSQSGDESTLIGSGPSAEKGETDIVVESDDEDTSSGSNKTPNKDSNKDSDKNSDKDSDKDSDKNQNNGGTSSGSSSETNSSEATDSIPDPEDWFADPTEEYELPIIRF